MATILKFKLPEQTQEQSLLKGLIVSSTVNDVMLIIHHALHGTEDGCRPKDQQLAAQLLDELSSHIKNDEQYEKVVLSRIVSGAILARYPEMVSAQ